MEDDLASSPRYLVISESIFDLLQGNPMESEALLGRSQRSCLLSFSVSLLLLPYDQTVFSPEYYCVRGLSIKGKD